MAWPCSGTSWGRNWTAGGQLCPLPPLPPSPLQSRLTRGSCTSRLRRSPGLRSTRSSSHALGAASRAARKSSPSGKCVNLRVTQASSRPTGLCQKCNGDVYLDALLCSSTVSFKVLCVDGILLPKPYILVL